MEFLVQLSNLCRQELPKRCCVKSEVGTEHIQPDPPNRETSRCDQPNRSPNLSQSNALPQDRSNNPEDVLNVSQKIKLETSTNDKNTENSNLKSKEFQCWNCSHIATSRPEYATHVISCLQAKQTGCFLCSEKFTAAEIDDHIKSVHLTPDVFKRLDDGSYYCIKCDKSAKYFSQFKKHLITWTHQGMNRCYACGIVLSSTEMVTHQIEFHGKLGDTSYICKICGMLYSSQLGLSRHISSAHEGKQEFKCPECGQIFNRLDNLRKHQKKHSNVRPYPCCFCDLVFKSKDNLKSHINALHFTKNKHQCPICKHVFNDKDRYDIHVRMFHEGRQFHCQICGQVYSSYSKKERHLQSHLNSYKKVKNAKKVNRPMEEVKTDVDLSAVDDHLESKEEVSTSFPQEHIEGSNNLKQQVGSVKLKKNTDRQNSSSGTRKKIVDALDDCENRSPSKVRVKRGRSEKTEGSKTSLKLDEKSDGSTKRYLAAKDSNIVTSKLSQTERTSNEAKPVSRGTVTSNTPVQNSCLEDGSCPEQTDYEQAAVLLVDETGDVSFCECPDEPETDCIEAKTDSLYPVKPCSTIPENTLFIYVNNSPEDDNTVDSFSSLRPDSSITESALVIDIDNIPKYESIEVIDLDSADICPVEVEYVNGEQDDVGFDDGLAHSKVKTASVASFDDVLAQHVVEMDSGVSLCDEGSLKEPPQAPARKKSKKEAVSKEKPKRKSKSKKYLDSGKKVIVRNVSTSSDDFILPEFLIDEDDD